VAILARGKGLPCLVALGPQVLRIDSGRQVVLDANGGRLELEPDPQRIAQVQQAGETQRQRHALQQQKAHEPALTQDGQQIEVAANVASSDEARDAHQGGADGVGLLRTEFLFVDRQTAPDQEEQRQAYQAVLNAMGDKPVIIRTIDVGGDKQLDYLPLPVEANPVLGLRGIRLAQARPELLDQQLRALLQVSPVQRCRVMLPMVTEVAELLHIRQRLDLFAAELGLSQRPELGVMIEVPAAALMAEQLAEHADFLSIGTNAGAQRHGRWVGVCGALASDPLATPVLIGLGVSELSVSPPQVGEIKDRVRQLDASQCRQFSQPLLNLPGAATVRQACERLWPLHS
jgi:phosphocarrier protein